MLEMQVSALNSEKSESFRFKIMEELRSKLLGLNIENEKREKQLLNSMNLFEEKLYDTNQRIQN